MPSATPSSASSGVHAAKPRSDCWDASLTEAQRWQAFDQMRRSPWYETAEWIAKEFGIPAPSRTALYQWAARMRKNESAHRVEQALTASAEIGALAGTVSADGKLIDAYKSLAADFALKGNAADAVRFTQMAMALAAQQTKQAEIDLKRRAQQTKDEQLALAREKFEASEARLASVRDALAEAKTAGGLTPETLRKIEEAACLL